MGYTFKKGLIQKYSFLTISEEYENSKLLLVTAIGIIQGTLVLFHNDSESSAGTCDISTISKITESFVKVYRADNHIDNNELLPGNDGGIGLKDVIINSADAVFNFPFLFIFYDQIIAATIGNF
ncbi:hypothetical protein [Lacrimispora sp.]|uniref:hypothetical protein n=1 Tax=Lacrimispora sp. TaxID=2719234 RepID=UPI0028ACC6C8|nr:hypothetical protein [Lacrimispora sp.]